MRQGRASGVESSEEAFLVLMDVEKKLLSSICTLSPHKNRHYV